MAANGGDLDTRLHSVYLLTSCDPAFKHHYYIGYTVDPLRRLRQHNGELGSGAWRTARRGRPWRIVLFVSGFTEDRAGLRFEWMWQNPHRAVETRDTVATLQLRRLPFAVAVLHLLLRTTHFANMALCVNVLDAATYEAVRGAALLNGIPAPVPSALLQIRTVTVADVERLIGNAGEHDDDERTRRLDATGAHVQRPVNLSLAALMMQAQQESVADGAGGLGGAPLVADRTVVLGSQQVPFDIDASSTASGDSSRRVGGPDSSSDRGEALPPPPGEADPFDEHGLVACTLCCIAAPRRIAFVCPANACCPMRCHVACLAAWFYAHAPPAEAPPAPSAADSANDSAPVALSQLVGPLPAASPAGASFVPVHPAPCPVCGEALYWPVLIQKVRIQMNRDAQKRIEGRRAMIEQRKALLKALEQSGRRRAANASTTSAAPAASTVKRHRPDHEEASRSNHVDSATLGPPNAVARPLAAAPAAARPVPPAPVVAAPSPILRNAAGAGSGSGSGFIKSSSLLNEDDEWLLSL